MIFHFKDGTSVDTGKQLDIAFAEFKQNPRTHAWWKLCIAMLSYQQTKLAGDEGLIFNLDGKDVHQVQELHAKINKDWGNIL